MKLKSTKHATTNFRMLSPYLDCVDASPEKHRRFLSGGYMPLVMENLGYTDHGGQVYAISHYGEQNGDLMADPDMTISVDRSSGTVEPLTYRNDYLCISQEVYFTDDSGRELYRPKLRTELDRYLWYWLKNIADQRFSPDHYEPEHYEPDDE